MENAENHVPILKRKKGIKQVVWKCEQIKKSRVKGEEYSNYKGNIVHSKTLGVSCK